MKNEQDGASEQVTDTRDYNAMMADKAFNLAFIVGFTRATITDKRLGKIIDDMIKLSSLSPVEFQKAVSLLS